MLENKWVLNNLDAVKTALQKRNSDISLDVLVGLDAERKELQHKFDELRALQNQKSKEISQLKKEKQDASSVIQDMQVVATQVKEIGSKQTEIEEQIKNILMTVPNIPHESVPVGSDEGANQLVRDWGEKPEFSFTAKEHWELGENLGLLDFERAAKIAGARFALYRGALAKLERALAHYMLEKHIQNGFEEVIVPYLVNTDSLLGTGQLPKFEEDLFKTTSGHYLIPTAEVPVTNIFRQEMLQAKDLPYKFCGFTPCFRSEAGSYGKDMKGLIRQHQFHKVEMVKITDPESSYDELESMTESAESILKDLKLPYRTMLLCSGDMGFGATKTYDLEVWLPGQNSYREISSCSNCEDFQARRMKTRFKGSDGKPHYVHTLNGSGLAVGRTLIAVMENYQQEDGSIVVPEVLKGFMGMDVIA